MAEWETDDSVHPLKEPYAAWRRDTRPAVEDPTRSIIPVILKVKSVDARLGFNEIAELLKKEQKNEVDAQDNREYLHRARRILERAPRSGLGRPGCSEAPAKPTSQGQKPLVKGG